MKSRGITIKDIARALGLANSTVSRALKDSHDISIAMRQKVQEYARQHQYRPNLQAQALRNQKSRCIGVVLCNIPNHFFAEVLNGIESIACQRNYSVIITQSLESYEQEIRNLDNLAWRSVDGLLVSIATETKDTSHFKKLQEQGMPIVFFDRVTDDLHTHQVIADNEGGVLAATLHFIEQGCQRIAHITSSPYASITRTRLDGHLSALQKAGLPAPECYIKYCLHGGMVQEEVTQALEELFALPQPPDALLAASDRLTLHCFAWLQKKGLAIPQDIALAGFSNFTEAGLFAPGLTTIEQPAFEMGQTAIELLINQIESKRPPTSFSKVVLPTALRIRASSCRSLAEK
ncbi:MAG: LacI family DNA-binding transcriptional regulator [Candidatus Pseudobacter hemicellulosilyticus]|uniref:LacI family DNA-binding transcriptional regulator n=1 Tax=Candidatus Pseudobacter hemicellulosilyticus TaxID=3121375 RepID=A0AAJ5WSB8_9BACT|nr:MAG: LacI family DNA-binding transcriptional regulator [Pseudobacter sp.]